MHSRFKTSIWPKISEIVGQIGLKNNHNTVNFCDEDLNFCTVIKEAMKNQSGFRAKFYPS